MNNQQISTKLSFLSMDTLLSRMPVKTLLKLRCLCKNLRTLIDSSTFTLVHLKNYNNSVYREKLILAIEFLPSPHKITKFTIHRGENFNQVTQLFEYPQLCVFANSCNGVILVQTLQQMKLEQCKVINPCSRKLINLPILASNLVSSSFYMVRYILGFIPCSNIYKVVAFVFGRTQDVKPIYMFVYTFGDGTWRRKQPDNIICTGCLPRLQAECPVICLKGNAYWIDCCRSQSNSSGIIEDTHLVSFDFNLEKLTIFELPNYGEKTIPRCIFLRGETVTFLSMSTSNTRIWTFNRNNVSSTTRPWSLWFGTSTNLDVYNVFNDDACDPRKILLLSNTSLLVYINKRIISYNILSQQIQHLRNFNMRDVEIDTFVESLVMPKESLGQSSTLFPLT